MTGPKSQKALEGEEKEIKQGMWRWEFCHCSVKLVHSWIVHCVMCILLSCYRKIYFASKSCKGYSESTNRKEQCPLEGVALTAWDLVGALFRCSHCSPTLTERLRVVVICETGIGYRRPYSN